MATRVNKHLAWMSGSRSKHQRCLPLSHGGVGQSGHARRECSLSVANAGTFPDGTVSMTQHISTEHSMDNHEG